MKSPAVIGAVAVLFLALPSASRAEEAPTKATCGASYVDGQHLLRQGSLKAARAALLVCARDPCPAAFQSECLGWLAEVDRRIPTIIFQARTEGGDDVADAAVLVDGAPLLARLDGREVEVDPGEHTFRFSREGAPPVDKTIVVGEGDKARRLAVTFLAPPKAPPGPASPLVTPAPTVTSRPAGWPVWVAGGVGVAGLLGFGGFAIAGLLQHDTLNACKGSCAPSDVSADRTKLEIADVSLAAGVAGLGAATLLYLLRPRARVASPAAVRVTPSAGPGSAGVAASVRF